MREGPLRFNFDTFGDRTKASSRLRAWMIADQLRSWGHSVTLNGSPTVDVQVFQKRRDPARLRTARLHGARIVLDFDDNYLLDEVGTKDDLLAFMNMADVVTVGSQDLCEQVGRFHDHVVLFENPLDVSPGSSPKAEYGWEERVAWFGSPENQGVLDELGLRERVRTITARGDIPWNLETVDDVLMGFDLVVIPVAINAWTMAKNSNRLLKCVALGVPFLASSTPEHRRIVEQLQLPSWLLVDPGDDWHERIRDVAARYDELLPLLSPARDVALAAFGVVPITEGWLREVLADDRPTHGSLLVAANTKASAANLDVVVFGEGDPGLIGTTLLSLRWGGMAYRSTAVVSPLPVAVPAGGAAPVEIADNHDDFFEIYESLRRVLASREGMATLVIQAGVELRPGFFDEVAALDLSALHLFRLQRLGHGIAFADSPPPTLDHLLTRPYRPAIVLVPNRVNADSRGLQPRFGSFAIWELLITLVGQRGVPLRLVTAPLAMVDPKGLGRTPLQSYAAFLRGRSPSVADDLPGLDNEWDRLTFCLQSAVIDAHRDLFHHYQSTVIPRLTAELARARQQRSDRQKEQQRASAWLAQLTGLPSLTEPWLARTEEGTVYLIEASSKRHVTTLLLAKALEFLFGPIKTVASGAVKAYKDGPPAEIFSDDASQLYFVAGGNRYRVRGLPAPVAATSDRLRAFQESDVVIDLARGAATRPPSEGAKAPPSPAAAQPSVRLTNQTSRLDDAVVPPGATLLVVSDGVEPLTQVGDRTAWPFPYSGGDGAGFSPVDGKPIIDHLEALRSSGADFLLIPSEAIGWLDGYPRLSRYLHDRYPLVPVREGIGLVYELHQSGTHR